MEPVKGLFCLYSRFSNYRNPESSRNHYSQYRILVLGGTVVSVMQSVLINLQGENLSPERSKGLPLFAQLVSGRA